MVIINKMFNLYGLDKFFKGGKGGRMILQTKISKVMTLTNYKEFDIYVSKSNIATLLNMK